MTNAHPEYVQWLPVWLRLGYVYRGDGPFLDGTALVPHPREITGRVRIADRENSKKRER